MRRWLLLSGLVAVVLTGFPVHSQTLHDALEGAWSRQPAARATEAREDLTAKLTPLTGGDKTELALVPVGENGLGAKGAFKVPAGTKAVATITLAGKPAINARFEIK